MNAPESNAEPTAEARPIHQPFSWVPNVGDHDRDAHFAALVLDVCNGVQTCLQLVHTTDLALHARSWGGEDQPLLSNTERERLLLLATASARLLGNRASDSVDLLNDRARTAAAGTNGGVR
ncbi:hypothetical protein E7V67_006260 [[Empedobacter] haloabium]|uniref:Uncharacterized protein n=1 Tax=[Empedobacter] haloabium TaxID=592317 RepID=A0ABZ1UPT8_9BURK